MLHKWTRKDIAYLKKVYPDMPNIEIAEHLGVSRRALEIKALRLGLRKSEERRRAANSANSQKGIRPRVRALKVDRWRWRTGQEQKTRRRFVSESMRHLTVLRCHFIHRARQKAYIYRAATPDTLYYTADTQRSQIMEEHIHNYNIQKLLFYEAQDTIGNVGGA